MKIVNENNGQPIYHLIAILEDAKNGYLSAAEKIRDEVLSLLFEKLGYQKISYINELRRVAKQSGFSSAIDQFTLSLLHRTWMDMKSAFRFGQRDAAIRACIKGEEKALMNYTEAIEQIKNNDDVKMVLEQQAYGIKSALHTIKEYTVAGNC